MAIASEQVVSIRSRGEPPAGKDEGGYRRKRPPDRGRHARQLGQGTLYCSVHIPLFELALRPYLELQHKIDLVVAHPGKIVNGDEFIVPGLSQRLKTLPADGPVLGGDVQRYGG